MTMKCFPLHVYHGQVFSLTLLPPSLTWDGVERVRLLWRIVVRDGGELQHVCPSWLHALGSGPFLVELRDEAVPIDGKDRTANKDGSACRTFTVTGTLSMAVVIVREGAAPGDAW